MGGSEPSARRRCPIDVFRYLDYRTFLSDFYEAKKSRGFSYRAFSRATGLGAPNYLKLVIAGKRNMTPVMAERFAASCGLAGDPASYFQQLVEFNQAKTASERNRSYERLASFRRYRQVQKLELAHAAYHSTWYLPAIRELVACNAITSTGAISTALAHPDVQAVLHYTENPIKLGDTRTAEVFQITIGMRQLELGGSCEGAPPDCAPVPPGVEALRQLLQQIDQAFSSPMGPCAGI